MDYNTKDIIDLPLDNEYQYNNKEESLTEDYDPNKVF